MRNICRLDSTVLVATIFLIDVISFVFAELHTHIKLVDQGDEIILGCLLDDSKAKVTVFIDNVEIPPTKMKFDPEKGFILKVEKDYLEKMVICRNDQTPDELGFTLREKKQKALPNPVIETHRNSFYVVGVTFSVKCKITVDEDIKLVIEWKFPNRHPDDKEVKYRIAESRTLVNELMVNSPSLKNSGKYTCIVKDDDGEVSATKDITIKDKMTPFVKFDTSQSLIYVEGQKYEWILHFSGFPNNLQYEFYDHYNRTIDRSTPGVSVEYDYDNGILNLTKDGCTPEDHGWYWAKISANNVSDVAKVLVIVMSSPKVTFDEIPSLFSPYENVSLRAFILSFTMQLKSPNVSWWMFNKCPNGIGSCDETDGIMLNHTLIEPEKRFHNRFESTVSFEASFSGMVVCEVENSLGKNSSKIYVNVSDTGSEFLLTVATESEEKVIEKTKREERIDVIEGGEIVIECYVLNFLFKDINFIPEGSTNCNTSLSSGRCLELNNVVARQNGSHYECQATNRSSKKSETLRFTINVIENAAPYLMPGSNVSTNGGMIYVSTSNNFSIRCLVGGIPKPTITWLKDERNILDIPKFVDNKKVLLHHGNQWLEFKFAQKEHEGKYTCRAQNRVGNTKFSISLMVEGAGLSALQWILVTAAIVFISALSLMVVILVIRIRKESKLRKELRKNQLFLFQEGNVGELDKERPIGDQAELLPYDKKYEVERERIYLGKLLGAGTFGKVMKAEVKDLEKDAKTTRVAVKMCRDGADMAHLRALTMELKIMIHLGKHLNIVNLMGAHTSNMEKGELWILVEYCRYGNLLTHIHKYKSKFVDQIDPVTGMVAMATLSHRGPEGSVDGTSDDYPSYANILTRHSHSESARETGRGRRTPSLLSKVGSSYRSSRLQRNTSTVSPTEVSRPRVYAGNPSYTPIDLSDSPQNFESTGPISPSGFDSENKKDHCEKGDEVATSQLSKIRNTSTSSFSSDSPRYVQNTDMTTVSSPLPLSPTSITSGHFFPSSVGHDGIPGISTPFTTTELICWAWQIANGMEYLSKRKVLHGDLAARNILLAAHNVVKISDFGLSRDIKSDIYMKQGDEVMPIKWMAPEAIQERCFSTQSDVWAFGVTLWELFTLGNTPYPGVPLNQEFLLALEEGMRMDKPKYSNDQLYDLMLQCWRSKPLSRPSFSAISETFAEMLSLESRENYGAMYSALMQKNEEWLMSKEEDYLSMFRSPEFDDLDMEGVKSKVSDNAEEDLPPLEYLPMDIMSDKYCLVPNETRPNSKAHEEEKEKSETVAENQILLFEDVATLQQTSNKLQNNRNENNEMNDEHKHQSLYQNLSEVSPNN